MLLLLFGGKVSRSPGKLKTTLKTLGLTSMDMLLYDVLSVEQLSRLVWNALELMVLDFLGNSSFGVVRHGILLVLCKLYLNLLRSIVNPTVTVVIK